MASTYYISIAGLELGLESITVGNITFLGSLASIPEPMAKKAIEKMLGHLRNDNPNSFAKKFENHSIAVVRVDESDMNKAHAIAEAEVERSLNILRFYLSAIFGDPFFYPRSMGMEGTIHVGNTAWLRFNESTGMPGTSSSRRGAYGGYKLGGAEYDILKESYFEFIEGLLRKPAEKRSKFQNSLLTAIDLVGTATNELMLRNGFLQCMFALEAALLRRKDSKTADMINLITPLFKVPAQKSNALNDLVRNLYGIRSDIVHEGIDKVDKDVAFNAYSLVFRVIIKLIPYAETVETKGALREKLNVPKTKRQKTPCK